MEEPFSQSAVTNRASSPLARCPGEPARSYSGGREDDLELPFIEQGSQQGSKEARAVNKLGSEGKKAASAVRELGGNRPLPPKTGVRIPILLFSCSLLPKAILSQVGRTTASSPKVHI